MPEIIQPRVHDIGGLNVRRALPAAQRRSVGPFVFFDHIGPHTFDAGEGIDVRPHPHIGLATVTFLWEGALMHRDSLGNEQEIAPGDVNWMTAGRGIVHSERTPERLRGGKHPIHGLQTWIGLPRDHEDAEPGFHHHAADTLPRIEREGVRMTVVAGHAFGERSPVDVFSGTLYVAIDLDAGAELTIPAEHTERALYPVDGELELDGFPLPNQCLTVLDEGSQPVLRARAPSRVMLCGGEPLDGPRLVWWNFVSSSRERIEQAKADWQAGRFGQVPGETEFIPLPS